MEKLPASKRLIIISVYYKSLGHLLEVIKKARGYYTANKKLEINLLVNGESPVEIIKGAPWITKNYPIALPEAIKYGGQADSIRSVPKNWDYILYDDRIFRIPLQRYKALRKLKLIPESVIREFVNYRQFYFLARNIFRSKSWPGSFWIKDSTSLKYRKNQQIIMHIPKQAVRYASRYKSDKLKICLMLGGSRMSNMYPRMSTWIKIITALQKFYPGILIYLTGVAKVKGRKVVCGGYSQEDYKKLFSLPGIINCYDIGFWNQIALIKISDIFLSHHTGFSFVSSCVKTPWLILSGGLMHENFFNDVPFYSVLPKNKDYPRHIFWQSLEKINKPLVFDEMRPAVLEKRIPEIIKAVKLLNNSNFTYKEAIKMHLRNIEKNKLDKKVFFSFDNALGLNKNY